MMTRATHGPTGSAAHDAIEAYRERTNALIHFNHSQKTCAGPCRQSRSVGQFHDGDSLCKKCRRRTPT